MHVRKSNKLSGRSYYNTLESGLSVELNNLSNNFVKISSKKIVKNFVKKNCPANLSKILQNVCQKFVKKFFKEICQKSTSKKFVQRILAKNSSKNSLLEAPLVRKKLKNRQTGCQIKALVLYIKDLAKVLPSQCIKSHKIFRNVQNL